MEADIRQAQYFEADTKKYQKEEYDKINAQRRKNMENARVVRYQIEHGI